jgi:hypothetical protein
MKVAMNTVARPIVIFDTIISLFSFSGVGVSIDFVAF